MKVTNLELGSPFRCSKNSCAWRGCTRIRHRGLTVHTCGEHMEGAKEMIKRASSFFKDNDITMRGVPE